MRSQAEAHHSGRRTVQRPRGKKTHQGEDRWSDGREEEKQKEMIREVARDKACRILQANIKYGFYFYCNAKPLETM